MVALRRGFVLLGLCLGLTGLAAQDRSTIIGSVEGSVTIRWEAVDGAGGYGVEIALDGAVFINTEVEGTSLSLNLAPATYDYRISVLDPFGNVAASSAWVELKVERLSDPSFRVLPISSWEGENPTSLDMDVSSIPDDVSFRLESSNLSIPLSVEERTGGFRVSWEDVELPPGSYDVVAIRPPDQEFRYPGALVIRPKRPPVFSSIEPSSHIVEGLVSFEIRGSDFDQEMEIRLTGPRGELSLASFEVTSEERARIWANLAEAAPGVYQLTLSNPSGSVLKTEDVLTLEAVPVPEDPPLLQPRFEFHAGLAPFLAWSSGDEVLWSPMTISMAVLFQSGAQKPFWNSWGVETRGTFGTFFPPSDLFFNNFHFGLDLALYYRPIRDSEFHAPLLLMGVGNRYWSNTPGENPLNLFYIRTAVALDLVKARNVWRMGFNIDWGFFDELVLMPGVELRRGFRF